MNNLILVRHGQSLWNKEKRFTGWADIDLTDQGKLEAKKAGQLIKDLNIEYQAYFASQLKRSVNTLEIILKVLGKKNSIITKAKELNERHYGGLTSLNKDDTVKKYGAKQVKIWRRSYNTQPPFMSSDHPYYKKIDNKVNAESLKDTFERVIPYYNKKIKPLILSKKNILIVFHGNSCRALLKKIFYIPSKKIVNLEIPTGNPLLIQFDGNLEIKNYKYLDKKRAKKLLFRI